MTLGPSQIEAFVAILTKPSEHNFAMKDFADYWTLSEKVTATHILAQQYMALNSNIPKIVVYILFERLMGTAHEVDENGYLGYKLEFIP